MSKPNLLLLQILVDYSNDLSTLSKRDNKLPAEAAVDRINDLFAHLASEARPPKSRKAQVAYRIENNDYAAVVKEKAYNKGVDTYYANILRALGRET